MAELLIGIIATTILAQSDASVPPSSDVERAQQRKWNEYYSGQATKYEIRSAGEPETLLKLNPKPVLFWSNPVRIGETNGAVFVWTHEGRAEVVGTIFSFLDRRDRKQRIIAHSFHSLSILPLAADRDGQPSWSIGVAGIQPRAIPDGPQPADLPSQRLLQMRALAREFTAATMQDSIERELRLLPQPIYRNQRSTDQSLDGALFTFVMGTDPELMLLIDIHDTATGPRWHYAAARFTDLTVKLMHNQTEVWSYERQLGEKDDRSPYVTGRFAQHSAAIE